METEDEDRIQDDVRHSADDDRQHTDLGKSLSGDKVVQSQGHLYEDGPEGIDTHVIFGVSDSVAAGTKQHKQRFLEDQYHNGQDNGSQEQGAETVSEDLFRSLIILLSHQDTCARRTAHSHQGGKG